MRTRLWIIVLLAVTGFELAEPPPALADFGMNEPTIVLTPEMKKARRKRRLYAAGGGCIIAMIGAIFITLNEIDRRVARRKLQQKALERQESGLL
jgi:hypothetical protein